MNEDVPSRDAFTRCEKCNGRGFISHCTDDNISFGKCAACEGIGQMYLQPVTPRAEPLTGFTTIGGVVTMRAEEQATLGGIKYTLRGRPLADPVVLCPRTSEVVHVSTDAAYIGGVSGGGIDYVVAVKSAEEFRAKVDQLLNNKIVSLMPMNGSMTFSWPQFEDTDTID